MLDEQGEKLRKVDRNLDDINAATVQTQRNLNNIKSVFGGIRNYFRQVSLQFSLVFANITLS